LCFNPSRGIAIIQTQSCCRRLLGLDRFQSLTRDSNHSNSDTSTIGHRSICFNPSRGIAIIQTLYAQGRQLGTPGFNPSRGIAIIQTTCNCDSERAEHGFNPSRGIAIIQTQPGVSVKIRVLVSIPHAG